MKRERPQLRGSIKPLRRDTEQAHGFRLRVREPWKLKAPDAPPRSEGKLRDIPHTCLALRVAWGMFMQEATEAQTFRSNAKESALEAHGRVRRVVGATCQRLVLDPKPQTLNPKPPEPE